MWQVPEEPASGLDREEEGLGGSEQEIRIVLFPGENRQRREGKSVWAFGVFCVVLVFQLIHL